MTDEKTYGGSPKTVWETLATAQPNTFFEQAAVSLVTVNEPWVTQAYITAAGRDPSRAMSAITSYAARADAESIALAAIMEYPKAAVVYRAEWENLPFASTIAQAIAPKPIAVVPTTHQVNAAVTQIVSTAEHIGMTAPAPTGPVRNGH